jgi:3-deoxy-manno-octulosonate cytidylyltransferase (CMP-KDO synthetase)
MQQTRKFIGIIPSRYASTRFPGKPLADIRGKPMIRWVYEQASKALQTVYVATDDDRIRNVVRDFGGRVVMTSPDHKSGTDRCAEALLLAERECRTDFDVVLNIQGDEPFVDPGQLELLMQCFSNAGAQIATLVKTTDSAGAIFDPNRPKVVVSARQEALYFSRSPIPFVRGKPEISWAESHTFYLHVGLYAYLKEVLLQITRLPQSSLEQAESLEQLRWIENGYRITVRTTIHDSLGIDTPEDLSRVTGV